MKEKDNIENFFKNRLSDNRQFDFRESDWADMESRLDKANLLPTVGLFEYMLTKPWFWILTTLIVTFAFGWLANDTFRASLVSQSSEIVSPQKTISTTGKLSEKQENDPSIHLLEKPKIEITDVTNEVKNDSGEVLIVENKTANRSENQFDTTEISNQKTETQNSDTNNVDSENLESNLQLMELQLSDSSNDKNDKSAESQSKERGLADESIIKLNKEKGLIYLAPVSNFDKNELLSSELKGDVDDENNQSTRFALDFVKFKILSSNFKNRNVEILKLDLPIWSSKIVEDSSTMDDLEKEVTDNNPYSRWSVGLSYAPDANSVGFAENLSLSNKFSFQLYYQISNRFSIYTGIAYSKKKYLTEGENYTPPPAYWGKKTNGVLPLNIDGVCSVIDIPLNLTYTWSPDKKIRILSTVGISNYILLDEDYQYEFEFENPGSDTEWVTDDNSQVYFGLANMSFAAAWNINPKLEIQIEPYLKVPIKKIGFGNVSLYSSGVYFTLKVKFLSRKRRYNVIRPPD